MFQIPPNKQWFEVTKMFLTKATASINTSTQPYEDSECMTHKLLNKQIFFVDCFNEKKIFLLLYMTMRKNKICVVKTDNNYFVHKSRKVTITVPHYFHVVDFKVIVR